jgi:hypothetical protein
MSKHKTTVLVDKYGELWTCSVLPWTFRSLCWTVSTFTSETEYFHIYSRRFSEDFIEGMGMKLLGEL